MLGGRVNRQAIYCVGSCMCHMCNLVRCIDQGRMTRLRLMKLAMTEGGILSTVQEHIEHMTKIDKV